MINFVRWLLIPKDHHMRSIALSFIAVLAIQSFVAADPPKYTAVEGWLKPAPGLESIGPSHGDIAVSSTGDVYVSVEGGPKPGIQVFDSTGKYLRNVADAPNDFHGFVIRGGKDGEF